MDLDISQEWLDRAETRLPPAYGGCRCSCHRIAGVKHIVACCHPTKDEQDIDRLIMEVELQRARQRD